MYCCEMPSGPASEASTSWLASRRGAGVGVVRVAEARTIALRLADPDRAVGVEKSSWSSRKGPRSSSTPQQWGAGLGRRPCDLRSVLAVGGATARASERSRPGPTTVDSRRTRKAGPRSGRSTCALAAWLSGSLAAPRASGTPRQFQVRPLPVHGQEDDPWQVSNPKPVHMHEQRNAPELASSSGQEMSVSDQLIDILGERDRYRTCDHRRVKPALYH